MTVNKGQHRRERRICMSIIVKHSQCFSREEPGFVLQGGSLRCWVRHGKQRSINCLYSTGMVHADAARCGRSRVGVKFLKSRIITPCPPCSVSVFQLVEIIPIAKEDIARHKSRNILYLFAWKLCELCYATKIDRMFCKHKKLWSNFFRGSCKPTKLLFNHILVSAQGLDHVSILKQFLNP